MTEEGGGFWFGWAVESFELREESAGGLFHSFAVVAGVGRKDAHPPQLLVTGFDVDTRGEGCFAGQPLFGDHLSQRQLVANVNDPGDHLLLDRFSPGVVAVAHGGRFEGGAAHQLDGSCELFGRDLVEGAAGCALELVPVAVHTGQFERVDVEAQLAVIGAAEPLAKP